MENIMQQAPDISFKLYNDKIQLSKFKKPENDIVYVSDTVKYIKSKETFAPWTHDDALRKDRSDISSIKRCCRTIRELSAKNVFLWFLTMTFNQRFVNRFSAIQVHKLFKNVIKRLKYKYGKIEYIAVAEHHKNRAIHYHLLINFEITPKIHRQTRSRSGHNIYTITDEFKKEDCFLTLEKLEDGNNINYLTKYMTKGNTFPLQRRFNATRGLNRSRLQEKVYFKGVFPALKTLCMEENFRIKYHYPGKSTTLVFDHSAERTAPALEFTNKDIKDEKLEDIFYRIIENLFKMQKSEDVRQKIEKKLLGKEVSASVLTNFELEDIF